MKQKLVRNAVSLCGMVNVRIQNASITGFQRRMKMQIVRCNKCGTWIGKDEDLGLYYELDTEYCPNCKCTEALMDVDFGCSFDDSELVRLWELFGDVAINDADEILEDFLGFSEGTDRMEIWHWFDERYSKGVSNLMTKGE